MSPYLYRRLMLEKRARQRHDETRARSTRFPEAGLDGTFAERSAQQLSVGEQQRVMLARALALEPVVLLLDEPTAALDERSRDAVERTLLDLHARVSAALIVVTHDQAQARRLGERVLVLEGGRVHRHPQAVRG